ncbi:hypothetical protein ACIPX0_15375 [Streptomyces sp. NPDC090075]
MFLPVLQEMREPVVRRADLLREPEMPPSLLELHAHRGALGAGVVGAG